MHQSQYVYHVLDIPDSSVATLFVCLSLTPSLAELATADQKYVLLCSKAD